MSDLPTDPYAGGPYVMWKGSEFVHVMVPLENYRTFKLENVYPFLRIKA